MARTLNRAMQNYPIGTYGPYRVDGFTRNDASAIRLTLNFENLAATATVVGKLELQWDGEAGVNTQVIERPSTTAVDKSGAPRTSVSYTLGIPRLGNERRNVTQGDVTFILTVAVRCSIAVETLA